MHFRKNGETDQLRIEVDKAFLTDESRAYPIVIDPDLMVTGATNTYDSFVSSRFPNNNYYTNVYLRTGRDTDYYARRTYIKFNLPNWIYDSHITSSYMRFEKYSGATPSIKAYRALSNWSSSTITWNTIPAWTDNFASPTAYNDSGNWWRMNVTDIVKGWRRLFNPDTNFGFMVKDATESGTTQWTTFYSSDASSPHKPELHIVYNVNQFLSFGYVSSSIDIQPYSFDATWQAALDQGLTNWNNSSAGVTFFKSVYSPNTVQISDYDWPEREYGRMYPSVAGSTLVAFRIYMDSDEITRNAEYLPSFITSVFVHELGHTIWLNDNPATPSFSIMKYGNNLNYYDSTFPSPYDVAGVDSKYL